MRVSEKKRTIHSITEVHRVPPYEFHGIDPYLLALVDVDEGFRMMVNVQTENHIAIKIRAAVTIVSE